LLVLIAVGQRAWIGLRRAQSIPEFRWVHPIAGSILQLVMDVMMSRVCSGVSHLADRLAYANQIASFYILGVGMQDFVRKAVRISDSYSTDGALPGICRHDAGYWRA
jgi:hypothetical protein